MEIESPRIGKKVCKKRYLPWLDPSYLPVNFRGTFRNISHLRKDFTTVEDDEETHELVMVAVAQDSAQHEFVNRFIYEGNKQRNLVQSQVSRVLENL